MIARLRTRFAIALVAAIGCALPAIAADDFCWKDSYGRGVGTIPTICSGGKENQAGLCYDKCRAGMHAVGPVCWSDCPPGYTDTGATCHINLPLTKSPTWVCTHYWPGWMGGGCRWKDSRCASGYTNVGLFCALDSAGKSPPAGFSGSYLDPMKNSYGRGAGTVPSDCGSKERDAGLCYDHCRAGYGGVGPVCWNSCPAGWVQCGMGCAKDTSTCATVTSDQVISSVSLIANAVSFGAAHYASSSVQGGAKVVKTAEEMSKLEKAVADAKKAWSAFKQTGAYKKYQELNKLKKELKDMTVEERLMYQTADSMEKLATGSPSPEEQARDLIAIAAVADPTGIASAVGAYTYPKCAVRK
jgi:hypothetical protein